MQRLKRPCQYFKKRACNRKQLSMNRATKSALAHKRSPAWKVCKALLPCFTERRSQGALGSWLSREGCQGRR